MDDMNKKIKINFKEKLIPIRFVCIEDKEFNALSFKKVIENFYDDDDINNYDLDTNIADFLCELGILRKHAGCRMATLYAKTDKFDKFLEYYNNLYYKE